MQAPRKLFSWLSFAICAPFLLFGQTLSLLASPEAGPVFVPYPDGLRLISVAEGAMRGKPYLQPFDLPETWNGLPLVPHRDALRMRVLIRDGLREAEGHLSLLNWFAILMFYSTKYGTPFHGEERPRLQEEFREVFERLEQLSATTFRGVRLFGGGPGVYWQDQPHGDHPIHVRLPDLSPAGLGMSEEPFDLDSVAHAFVVLAVLREASFLLARERAELEATSLRLEEAPLQNGLKGTAQHLWRMRELAFQAANGTLNTGERAVFDVSFQDHVQSLGEVAEAARFRDINLLDGETDALLEGPPPAHLPIFLDLPDATPAGLGLSSATFDLTTVSNASAAIATIDAALEQVADYRQDLQAARARLLTLPGLGHVRPR